MATVKFISEKDCRLFIDMDYVGDILANTMFKITLGTGSYLIEAKDSNGRTIKKYELKINSENTQVLQNITLRANSIEDSIGVLKEDSSLRFYNQRALLKHDDKYGYINSQYKLIISPIYSYAEDFICGKTLVKKQFPDREMATIIDTEGNICFERWSDFFGSSNESILLKDNDTYTVFSRKDFSIIGKYIDAGYDGKGSLIPVCKKMGVDDMYGYIDKVGNEIIPFIYDYAWNFEDTGYAKVKRFGQIYAVDNYGNLYLGIPSSEDDKENIVMLTKEESADRGFPVDFFSGEEIPIKEGDCWGLGGVKVIENTDGSRTIIQTNKINSYKCDRILYYTDEPWKGRILVYRIGNVCTLTASCLERTYSFKTNFIEPIIEVKFDTGYDNTVINNLILKNERNFGIVGINNEIVLPTEYDSIVPILKHYRTYAGQFDTIKISGYIVEKNKKYGIANHEGKFVLQIEYDAIIPTEARRDNYTGDYSILWKNGKCSLVNVSTGQILFPFIYDEITINDACCELFSNDSTFLVKKNGKYGFATFEKGQIIDTIYDAISFKWGANEVSLYYYLMLKKNGKMGVYEYCDLVNRGKFEFFVEPLYEECVFLHNDYSVADYCGMSYVAVKLNDKWGILDVQPAKGKYFPIWENCPNYNDLEFKYDSLNKLKKDADSEFKRRYNKYHGL